MTEIVTLEDSPRAHMPGSPRSVIQDGRGRFWLTYQNSLPLVYGADGQLIRELGPRGEGPGELRAPALAEALPGDSVLLRDVGAAVVVGPDLRVARKIALTGSYGPQVVLEWPDMVLFKGPGRVEREGSGVVYVNAPFQLVSLGTERSRVINTIGEAWGGGGVARAGPFAAWSWEYNPYRLERWSAGGVLGAVVDRRPSWLPFTEIPMVSPQRGERPPAHLQAAQQDGAGRLWVFANVPVEVWSADDPIHPGNAMEKYFRTRVEVIDADAGRVIASTAMDGWIVAALPGQRAAVYGTDPRGTPFVRIVQLALVQ
jgi:hypothetical protein